MKKRIVGLLLISTLAATADAVKKDRPYDVLPCDPPPQFSELRNWMAKTDKDLLKTARPPARGGDVQLPMGAILRESCFKGARKKWKDKIVQRYQNVLTMMLVQTSKCDHLLGFPGLRSVEPISRILDISCAESAESKNAEAVVFRDADDIDLTMKLKRYKSSGYDHYYEVVVNTKEDRDLRCSEYDAATTFLHEILHHAGQNNREAHNSTEVYKSADEISCDSQIFSDRVYFLSQACFPTGALGPKIFEEVMQECPQRCENMFMESDTSRKFTVAGDQGWPAKPLSKEEAKLLCKKLTRVSDLKKATAKWEDQLLQSYAYNVESHIELNDRSLFEGLRRYMFSGEYDTFRHKEFDRRLRELELKVDARRQPFKNYFTEVRSIAARIKPDYGNVLDFYADPLP